MAIKRRNVLAWDKSAFRRARSWAGENVARSKGAALATPKEVERLEAALIPEEITSELGGIIPATPSETVRG